MDFNNSEAIYVQIADYVCDRIQTETWKPEEKIPSVRELAVTLEVNPNTVMRAYDQLQQQDIIFTKRGMGYFVQVNAASNVTTIRKAQFVTEELPRLYAKMNMLKIDIAEIEKGFDEYNRLKK